MSLSSIEFLDQGVSIPYHKGLSLGFGVDLTQAIDDGGYQQTLESNPTKSQVDSFTCQYSLATSFSDVCKVLDIPPEYALKVKAGLLINHVVSACLQDIYSKKAFKLIIRLRFIKEIHHFLGAVKTINNDLEGYNAENESTGTQTHVVEAVCLGEEMVIIVTIASPGQEALAAFRSKLKQILGKEFGVLNQDAIIPTLKELSESVEKKMSKSHYSMVQCDIQYGGFIFDDRSAGSLLVGDYSRLSGMVDVVKQFVDKWTGGMTDSIEKNFEVVSSDMKVIKGTDCGMGDPSLLQPADPPKMFKLRATLQPSLPVSSGDSIREDHSGRYEAIFKCLYSIDKTKTLIEGFLHEHSLFSNPKYVQEGDAIRSTVVHQHQAICDVIKDRIQLTKELKSEEVDYARNLEANVPELVQSFIEKVTTTLPTGGELNLLIIGKTGHGKSSTANSILRRTEFKESAGGISETKTCQTAWAEADGRIFKVVDVPGVCDTDLESVDSAKLAIRCISEAISSCSTGFHALLIVIRYGNRMTEEEERAIYILKCILGSAIVSTHCICVVTHGDNFESSEGTFSEWCKKQQGFLKTLFEECNYRCVLFNNKTKDPEVIKTQLIELVTTVDNLETRGTCYTNEIFKHVEKDRERLLQELQLPQFKEEIFRDLDLIQSAFIDVENADESQKNFELDKLKLRCDDLISKLDQIQCSGISDLYLAVTNLSGQISSQKEKNLKDVELRAQQQAFLLQQEKMRADALELEKKLAEETEKRVKEEAAKAQLQEDLKTKYEPKKSRWVKFRDAAFKW